MIFKKRSELEADSTAVMVYQDEVHFQIQITITYRWFKRGSAPTIKPFPSRFKVSYSGFVIPETGNYL